MAELSMDSVPLVNEKEEASPKLNTLKDDN